MDDGAEESVLESRRSMVVVVIKIVKVVVVQMRAPLAYNLSLSSG